MPVDVGDELDEDADDPEPDDPEPDDPEPDDPEPDDELEEDDVPVEDGAPVEELDPVAAFVAAEREVVPAGISFAARRPRAMVAAAAAAATLRDTKRTRPAAALGRRAADGVVGVMRCMEAPESRATPRVR